ncbi:Protein CFI-1 [Aphelenchoides avenae]|nr:Protein CFI-1 [Aphelenchus avenae]
MEHGNGHGEPEDLSIGKEKKGDGDDNSSCTAAPSNWSYEEQFKQLYDISDDPKRKEWLDDWLSFMHRIGKPVTRIPIMAKQVLDLYELYRLVVQHGGLVEIINKKLWREITKGLNLPSSITSAAFTLRTQYQKYLYDYECERENLSTPGDLQAAIEGNRREGRRNAAISTPNVTSVGSLASNGGVSQSFPFPLVPHSAAVAAANSFFGKHLNAFGLHQDDDHSGMTAGLSSSTQQALAAAAAYKVEQLAGLEAQQRQFELFQRAAAEAAARQHKRPAPGGTRHSDRDSTSSFESDSAPSVKRRRFDGVASVPNARAESPTEATQPVRIDKLLQNAQSTHMKLTSARTPTGENTMVVSLEVNGNMYQGVLFAVNSNGTNSQSALSLATNATDLSDLLNGDST